MDKVLIDLNEAQSKIVDFIGSEDFHEKLKYCQTDDKNYYLMGAMWGLSMAGMIIGTKCERFYINDEAIDVNDMINKFAKHLEN